MSHDAPAQQAHAATDRRGIDPRGQRIGAGITSVVLAIVLVTSFWPLLVFQALVFLSGVALGPTSTPYSWVFKKLVRPRIGAPQELEDPAPPRFAQGVGLAFAVVGVLGYALGSNVVGAVATGFALVAALLNASIGLCLGCEMYLLGRRLAAR